MTVVYKSSEVMKLLDVKESVFKKYVSLIEKEGFVFQKNAQGHRMFSGLDVQTLETFMKLSRYDGVTLESVAKKVAEWRKNKGHDDMTGNEIQEQALPNPQDANSHDVMTLVDSLLREQEQRFTSQIQQLIQQQNEMTTKQDEKLHHILLQLDRMDQREQERNRMMQEEKEAQMQIAATQEKRSWRHRFFDK
ncbi:hypothetical protein [Ectobacillus funiculus]|uniref:MerR family transcriptional regulator n=1 Tax=Ectobacillus funiculus TaxID=137993 RepID=A0ABV5WEV6_9BACI